MNEKTQDGISRDFDRYRVLFDQAPVCIHEIDAEGRLLSMNRAGLDLVGVDSEEQFLGRAYLDFVSPSEWERIRRLMDDAFTGQASEFEFPVAGTAPLNRMIDEVGGIITALREVGQELRPLFLERMELKDAIRYHCSEQSTRAGLAIHVSGHWESFPLEEWVKEQCFLSFREALNNAVRHATATRIDVTLDTLMPESLALRIDDDGVGFDPGEAFSLPSGLGLSMIAERAESVGGHAEIHSTPGQGTAVTIIVPLAPDLMSSQKLDSPPLRHRLACPCLSGYR